MDKRDIIQMASSYVETSEYNLVSKEVAISEDVVGLKMYDTPILGFAAADDEYFTMLKQPQAIGQHFMLPQEWLPQAKTVISMFLPFTEAVKRSNQEDVIWPSKEWLHARVEGQAFINKLCSYLSSELTNAGYKSLAPSQDERFWFKAESDETADDPISARQQAPSFTSNWSERHVAFVCGLGTFGLSRGIITRRGMAGRLASIITDLYIEPDKRTYKDIYEYCIMCGACARNCPAKAISFEKGKNHEICSQFMDKIRDKYKPRYGCGKCQVKVPCESAIPKKND